MATGRIVYSYIRWSSPEQEKGDSERRQTEGQKWIERCGHTPAAINYRDSGVSAFRGKNRHNGALGKFLDEIRYGRIKPGSILLVENLDRLSRQQMKPAKDLFEEIIEAGVDIAVLMPYERLYTKATLEEPWLLMEPLTAFHLAYLESLKKSKRAKEVWATKRKRLEADGTAFNTRRPSWIDHTKNGFRLNDGAAAIRFIFEATANGMGQRQVLGELQNRFKPIVPPLKPKPGKKQKARQWNGSFISKVLNDRATVGELQPKTITEEGRRVAVGEPVPGYYPAAIDEALWYRAQSAKANRKRMKGPSSGFVNLFTGLIRNAHDGHPVHIQCIRCVGKGGKPYTMRRLASYGHLSKIAGSDPVTVDLEKFEAAMMHFFFELKVADMENKGSLSAVRSLEQQLAGCEQRIKEIEEAIADPDNTECVKALLNAVKMATTKRDEVKADLEAARVEVYSDAPLSVAHDAIVAMFEAADRDQRHALRMRLRTLIAELVESITLKPEKHYGRVWWLAQVNFRNGRFRQLQVTPEAVYGWAGQRDAHHFCNPHTIDLRDRKACRKSYFAADAKAFMAHVGAKVVEVPKAIPTTVGGAAEVWLAQARGRMLASSYRVVPSKIARLVDFLQADLPTKNINAVRWARWTEHCKTLGLASRTAGVTWRRSREFVVWLMDKGRCPKFKLEGSSAKVVEQNRRATA